MQQASVRKCDTLSAVRDLEGSEVLERFSEIGLLDAFMEAVDGDDLDAIRRLLKEIDADAETVARILRQVSGDQDS